MPKCNVCGNTKSFWTVARLEAALEYDEQGKLKDLKVKKINPSDYGNIQFYSMQCRECDSLDIDAEASAKSSEQATMIRCQSCGYRLRLKGAPKGKKVRVNCTHCSHTFEIIVS